MLGLWLAVGLAPLLFSVQNVRLAFGLTGEPGKATVERCVDYGAGKNSRTECRGRFRPDDSQAAPRTHVLLPPESDEGETFTARLRPDGVRAHPADIKGRLGALSLPALGVLFLLPFPWALVFLYSDRRLARASLYVLAVLAATAGGLCLAGLIAGLL
ncbi:hypothetical protein GCM10023085_56440 [Actinomadura viridis]|uniref:DUF3592 domain-containing protein n=1 Tax=Actinomadura viridis TaxID=58110 RepID=A0A931D946_9ACTN|nr:hypothetical protein [Actinomadura viridis]MBG6085915.1 hypothetical protein [Actinomadura viridis]